MKDSWDNKICISTEQRSENYNSLFVDLSFATFFVSCPLLPEPPSSVAPSMKS